MKYFYIISVLILFKSSTYCECAPIDYKKLFKDSEVVLIATPIKNIHPDKQLAKYFDKSKLGSEVLMNVVKVYKGKVENNHIIVYQLNQGNCSKTFKFGENYVMFGYQIKEFKFVDNKQNLIKKGEIYFPLNEKFEDNILSLSSIRKSDIRFWNRRARKNTIITTSSCSSFKTNTKIIANLKAQ